MDPSSAISNSVSTHLSRHRVSLNAHQGATLTAKEWASFSDSIATTQFAQGALYSTIIAEFSNILRESNTVIAPTVQADIENLFRRFQAEFTGGHAPVATLFLERRRADTYREQYENMLAFVNGTQTSGRGPERTSFHRLPPLSGL